MALSRSGMGLSEDFTNTEIAICPIVSGRIIIPTSFVVIPMVPVLCITSVPGGNTPFNPVSYTHLDVYKRQVQYLRPDLVHMSRAVNDSSAKNIPGPMSPVKLHGGTYNPSGINGYATLANKKTGKKYLEAFANTIAAEIKEVQMAVLPVQNTQPLNEYVGKYMTLELSLIHIYLISGTVG